MSFNFLSLIQKTTKSKTMFSFNWNMDDISDDIRHVRKKDNNSQLNSIWIDIMQEKTNKSKDWNHHVKKMTDTLCNLMIPNKMSDVRKLILLSVGWMSCVMSSPVNKQGYNINTSVYLDELRKYSNGSFSDFDISCSLDESLFNISTKILGMNSHFNSRTVQDISELGCGKSSVRLVSFKNCDKEFALKTFETYENMIMSWEFSREFFAMLSLRDVSGCSRVRGAFRMNCNNNSNDEVLGIISDTYTCDLLKFIQTNIQSNIQTNIQSNIQTNIQSNIQTNIQIQSNIQSNIQTNIQSNIQSNPIKIKKWMHQLLTTMSIAHSRGIYHRDIKLENLFLDNNDNLIVGDWDSSFFCLNSNNSNNSNDSNDSNNSNDSKFFTNPITTICNASPELLENKTNVSNSFNASKLDSWSIGCVFGHLLTGSSLFDVPENRHADSILNKIHSFKTPDHWPGFIHGLLEICPEKRLTVKEALDYF